MLRQLGALHSICCVPPLQACADGCVHQHQEEKPFEHKTVGSKKTAPSGLRTGILDWSYDAALAEGDPCQAMFSYLNQTPKIIPTLDPQPKCALTSEPLRIALRMRSFEKVCITLKKDPDQAFMPFAGGQPPICEAIKCHCELAVVDLLIAHGSDPSMLDCHGRSALLLLASLPRHKAKQSWQDFTRASNLHGPLGDIPNIPWLPSNIVPGRQKAGGSGEFEETNWTLQVAERLLKAGCDPMELDSEGNSIEKVAAECGWEPLAELICQWKDFKVCLVLHRSLAQGRASAMMRSTKLVNLGSNLQRCVYHFVVGSKFFAWPFKI